MKTALGTLMAAAAVLALVAQAQAKDVGHANPAAALTEGPAIAKRYTPAYQKCLDAPGGQSTMGMIDCIGDELKVQDFALNAAYKKAMRDLTPGEKTNLQRAQRAWIAFRDADCAALDDPEQWGSISRINANVCVLDRTIERTVELENFPPDEAGPGG